MQKRTWYFKRTSIFLHFARGRTKRAFSLLCCQRLKAYLWTLWFGCKLDFRPGANRMGLCKNLKLSKAGMRCCHFCCPGLRHAAACDSHIENVCHGVSFLIITAVASESPAAHWPRRGCLYIKKCWYKNKFLKLNFYLRRPNFALQLRTPPTPGRGVCCCNL